MTSRQEVAPCMPTFTCLFIQNYRVHSYMYMYMLLLLHVCVTHMLHIWVFGRLLMSAGSWKQLFWPLKPPVATSYQPVPAGGAPPWTLRRAKPLPVAGWHVSVDLAVPAAPRGAGRGTCAACVPHCAPHVCPRCRRGSKTSEWLVMVCG